MTTFPIIKRFTREEDGSLLVFFLVCIVTILGIFALSFDMGRRASTQTDMQSFADNVALAAAGELDGAADSTTRATAAATAVIIAGNETLKAGTTGNAAAAMTIDQIRFYEELPNRDTPTSFAVTDLENSKYTLPASDLANPLGADASRARYVGVRLSNESVDWLFAGLTTANTPNAAVSAVAVAGNSGWTCEVSPLMFCLPMEADGVTPQTLATGRAVQLRTVGRDAQWNPGEFGFLDIDWLLANTNAAAGPCAGENPESRRQACMLARGIHACFNSRGVEIQPGQRQGQEATGFNLPFGVFEGAMNQLANDPGYETGPHIVSGRDIGNNCRDNGASGDTMAFPLDDCHYSVGGCADNRFGDGIWTNGKADYLDTNYRHVENIGGTPTEIHPGNFFDFPVDAGDPPLTRYQYYLLEIERAANGGIMPQYTGAQYNSDNDGGRGPGPNEDPEDYLTWDDYWPDTLPASGFNPIIPEAQGRSESGLPSCNTAEVGASPDRRVVIVAGIDCVNQTLTGRESNVPVVQYYRTFMLSPTTSVSGSASQGQQFDLWVEIIEPIGGEGGGSTTADTAFREVIQLYR